MTFRKAKPWWASALRDQVHRPLDVAREGAPDPRRPERDRELARVERALGVAVVRRLRLVARRRRRRHLPLRQAVDLVVHQEIGQVEVSAGRVEEVIAADGEAVAVAADRHDVQLGAGDLDAGRERQGAAMDAVEAVRRDVAGEARRAADAGDDDRLPRLPLQLGHGAVEGGQGAEVAAARAPDGLQVGLVVGDGESGNRGAQIGTSSRISLSVSDFLISSSTSGTVRFLPPERAKTFTRPSGRSTKVLTYL